MSLCLNPSCGYLNPITANFCESCDSILIVQNRYRAHRVLGEGGFAKTYYGVDLALPGNPPCVLKQFTYDDPETVQEAQRLFSQEAIRLQALGKHPQIPQLLAHLNHEGSEFLIQEFIDGINLLEELRSEGVFSEPKIVALLSDILPVLQFVHNEQVIHRDIKPENIIRRQSDGRCVLIDFGAAKLYSGISLNRPGTKIGSPGYSAPEQRLGSPHFTSDLYSLAKTCTHLLCGKSPDSVLGKKEKKALHSLSPRLTEILNTMMEEDMGDRFPSASDAWYALNFTGVDVASLTIASPRDPLEQEAFTLEMVTIPPGVLYMGSPDREENRWKREGPLHRVEVMPFSIGKYPVTQHQYREVTGKSPSKFQGDHYPVERVSWFDAQEFCELLSQRTQKNYRLPSEAEWEYACRAGTKTPYYFGETITAELVNFEVWGKPTRVGSFPANAFGVYDMHGNVWEWCADFWHFNYLGAPTNSQAWIGEDAEAKRVLRGGSWISEAKDCRSAHRKAGLASSRVYGIGFRVALSSD